MSALPGGTADVAADGLGRLVLHGAPGGAGSASTVPLEYVVASVLLVGLVGGFFYWYYGRSVGSR